MLPKNVSLEPEAPRFFFKHLGWGGDRSGREYVALVAGLRAVECIFPRPGPGILWDRRAILFWAK